jgi:glycosyltransferase involved in cell wall biosynthesis
MTEFNTKAPSLIKRKRVLIAYTEMLEYRVAVFESLSAHYDVTVVHSGRRLTEDDRGFDELIIPLVPVWRLRFQPRLRKLIRTGNYDAVIFFMDVAWLDIMLAFLFPPYQGRRITWGLWRTGRTIADVVRFALARLADCNVFYSRDAAEDFMAAGLPAEKISVAVNSFHVREPGRNPTSLRDSILVVGSFNPRKQNDVTVAAFAAVAARIPSKVRLVFVGQGADLARIEMLSTGTEVANRIEFHPATHQDEELRYFYDRALCSVSFGQAGLSVLQSFAYGVPFVTRSDAITGGERENIVHGQNGMLCDNSQASLEEALERLVTDTEYARRLGAGALAHYIEKASVRHMISGFILALEGNGG